MPDTSNNLRFRVGDEIELRVRVTDIDLSDDIEPYGVKIVGYDAHTMYLSRKELENFGELVSPSLKVGDKVCVRGAGWTGKVIGTDGDYFWIGSTGLGGGYGTYRSADLERVP